jgi:hypothetical protein
MSEFIQVGHSYYLFTFLVTELVCRHKAAGAACIVKQLAVLAPTLKGAWCDTE